MTYVWAPRWKSDQVDMTCCRASVADGGRSVSFHQCVRKGVVEEDGHLWCRQHAPSAQRKRDEESRARYEAQSKMLGRRYAREDAYTDIAATAIKYFRQEATLDELEAAVIKYERLIAPTDTPAT